MVEPDRRCLGDRYELHRLIATGGMGQVWRGVDVALGRPVVVKVLRSEYTGDPSFLARFRAEAQHTASLSSPNVAAVFDYGEVVAEDGTGETLAYLVMELVEGRPLSAVLADEGRLDVPTTLSVLRQTATALAEAHRGGLVHRDVKPGNILVRPDGRVKITDFGIAWSARSVALTRTGQVLGTPQYLSPEQAEGRLATPASDVYALGLIGYECLAGHPAFDGDNAVTIALKQLREPPEPLPADLPAHLRELLGRAMAKDPAARMPDGAAFVAAVDEVMAGRSPGPATAALPLAGGGEPTPRARRTAATLTFGPPPRRRRRPAVLLLPLLGLLAGAAIAVAALQAVSGQRPADTAAAADGVQSESILLDAKDYNGRRVDVVTEELIELGLNVDRRAQPSADAVPDMVLQVEPAGRPLRSGATVVVLYAVATGRDDASEPAAVTGASGGGDAPAGETSAPVEPTASASATTPRGTTATTPGGTAATTPGGTAATTPGGTAATTTQEASAPSSQVSGPPQTEVTETPVASSAAPTDVATSSPTPTAVETGPASPEPTDATAQPAESSSAAAEETVETDDGAAE